MSIETTDLPTLPASGNGEVVDKPGSKDAWLTGPSDLVEQTIPLEGDRTIRVRSLTAGQQGRISEQCTSMKGQKITVDQTRIKVLTFAAGCVEPQFDEHEANQIAHRLGHDFELVVGVINSLSGATEEDIEKAKRRFRPRR